MKNGLALMGIALALAVLSVFGAHAENWTAHPVIIDSTLRLADGTTVKGVREIISSTADGELARYKLIRIQNRLPPYTVRGGNRMQLEYQRWNSGRLDIYAKNMTAARLRVVLRENGLHPTSASWMESPQPIAYLPAGGFGAGPVMPVYDYLDERRV